jgi:hypothetical protein
MRILLIFTLCLAAMAPVIAQDSRSVQEPQVVGRITVTTDDEMQRVVQLGLDLVEYREGNDLLFVTTQKELSELQAAGWSVRIDEQRTAELPQPGRETFGGGYRTVEETYAYLDQLQAAYPNLAAVVTYGQSWQKLHAPAGYNLKAIVLTKRDPIASPKPTLLIQGGIHAREYVPPELATRFAQYLLSNYGIDADATWLLNEHKIVIAPIFNPDGRKIAETGQLKRKNMNHKTGGCTGNSLGIDLNRNYSFSWGLVNRPTDPPCGETWPGLSANSEPEVLASQDLIRSLFPDQRLPDRSSPAPLAATGVFLDMHSYGNLMLYPWGQDNLPPPNMQLQTIARKAASYNGYDPIQTIDLYPTSGTSQDFAYGELGVAGFGMEVGNSGTCGGFMPPYSCLDGGNGGNFWNLNRPVLLYLAKIARTPYMTGEGPNTETLTISPGVPTSWNLRAQITDANNGNQNIAAAEVYIDTPPWRGGTPTPMIPEDGSFNSPTEFATAQITVPPGRHIMYVRGRDTASNWGAVKAVFKVDVVTVPKPH